MNGRVEFLSGADADLQNVFNRFEDYREGFGAEFLAVIDAYLTRISTFPENCADLRRKSPAPSNVGISVWNILRSLSHAYLGRCHSRLAAGSIGDSATLAAVSADHYCAPREPRI